MPEFYMRNNNPFSPVYEVDSDAKTWKLVASNFGVLDMGGSLPDGSGMFKTDKFTQVWKVSEGGETVTFTPKCPQD